MPTDAGAARSYYYRPTEVETLLGDATKAAEKLGWRPQITLDEMITEMVEYDYRAAQHENLIRQSGI